MACQAGGQEVRFVSWKTDNLEFPYNAGTTAWHNAEECFVFRNADILGFFPPGPSKMYVATGYPPAE